MLQMRAVASVRSNILRMARDCDTWDVKFALAWAEASQTWALAFSPLFLRERTGVEVQDRSQYVLYGLIRIR